MKPDLAAAALAALALFAGAASAAEYVTIAQEVTVDRPADAVWSRVAGYCDIGGWLKTSCVVTSGAGEVGTVRRIADRIDEVLVARTDRSYTYAQPKSPIDYHGTVEVRADGPQGAKILYTLIYDAEALKTPEAKAADRDRRARMFAGVLQTMKAQAEAN
jgi:hypothetical protein